MNPPVSPEFDMSTDLAAQVPPQQLDRRPSRSTGSQCGHHSSRIEKPRSNHNSPRTLERRKTTSGTKRYATLDDHFNMMFGLTGEEEAQEDQRDFSRPVSWHPSSTQFQAPSRSSAMLESQYCTSSRNSVAGSDFYSMSARSSVYPDYFQSQPHGQTHRGSDDSNSSWQSHQTPAYAMSAYSTPATEPMPWYLREWARKNQAEINDSRNDSIDFLPIQHPAESSAVEDEDMGDSGKELVGMGLYDLPDPSTSWGSLSLVEGTGKGLKLEETWQPPEENEDEEEDAEADADDSSSDSDSVEELPAARATSQLPITDGSKPRVSHNLDGQSFFFEEDETYTKEWWFHQLKQTSVPVRDAGLGYGWL